MSERTETNQTVGGRAAKPAPSAPRLGPPEVGPSMIGPSRGRPEPPRELRIGRYAMPLPTSRAGRITVGALLVLGGTVGFLPIVGFWMLPLGLAVLAHDVPAVRRFERNVRAWWHRRNRRRRRGV